MTKSRMSASAPVKEPKHHFCVGAQHSCLGQHTHAPTLHKPCMLLIQFQNCEPNLATCTKDVLHSIHAAHQQSIKVVLILGEQSEGRLQGFLSHNHNLKFVE